MALDSSQFYTDPSTGTKYTSIDSYNQNVKGIALPTTVDPNTAQTPTSQAISVDQLQTAKPITVPEANPAVNPLDATAASAQATSKSLDQYVKDQTTPELSAERAQYDSAVASLNDLLPGLSGRGQDQVAAEQQAGLPDLKQKLAGLNAQILAKVAEANKTNASYEQLIAQQEGQGLTTDIVTAKQGAIRRTQLAEANSKSADIGLLQAIASGMQGNITAMQDGINRAIDLKYKDREDTVDLKMKQLQLLEGKLTKDEQITKDALTRKYTDEQKKLEEEKAKAKENINLAFSANVQTPLVNKGGEFFRTSDGKAYSTPEELFKDFGVTSFDQLYKSGKVTDLNASRVADIEFTQQLRAKYPDAGININDTAQSAAQKLNSSRIYQEEFYHAKSGGGGGLGTIPSTTETTGIIANDAQAVLEGRNTLYNIRQTMGRTNAAAAYMQSLREAITKVDPKFDFVASDAGGKAVSSSYFQKSIASINSVLPNIDKAVELSDQVGRIGVKGVDALLQKGQLQLGNQKVANFHQAQKLIADEIGVALGAGTVSDMKLQLGFDVTDPNVKPEVFASNMALVKEFITNRKQALNELRYQSSTTSTGVNSPPSTTGQLLIQDKKGNQFTIPADQLKEAVGQGYVLIKKL